MVSVGVLVVVVGGGCQKESQTKAVFGRQQLSLNSPIHPRLSWFWLGVSWRSGYCRVSSEKHPQSVWRGSWWRLVCDGLGCWIERSFPLMYQRNSLLRFCVAPPTILLMLIMTRLWTIARILGTNNGRQKTIHPHCHPFYQSPIHLEPSVSGPSPFVPWEAHRNLLVFWFLLRVVPNERRHFLDGFCLATRFVSFSCCHLGELRRCYYSSFSFGKVFEDYHSLSFLPRILGEVPFEWICCVLIFFYLSALSPANFSSSVTTASFAAVITSTPSDVNALTISSSASVKVVQGRFSTDFSSKSFWYSLIARVVF